MRDNKEPWLAAALSMLLPGAGQLYVRAQRKGIFFLLLSFLLLVFVYHGLLAPAGRTLTFIIGAGLLLLVGVLAMVDAHRSARKSNSPEFESERRVAKDPWLAVFISALIPGGGHFYLRKWLWGAGFLAAFLVIAVAFRRTLTGVMLHEAVKLAACFSAYVLCQVRREKNLVPLFAVCVVSVVVLSARLPLSFPMHQTFKVASDAMSPTFVRGDRILVAVNKGHMPVRGEIIVFRYMLSGRKPESLVKRAVAIAGDTVDFAGDSILVNGGKVAGFGDLQGNARMYMPTQWVRFPLRVPDGTVFVLGDNFENSMDSRYHGPIPVADVVGTAYKVVWPLSHNRSLIVAPGGER